MNKWRKSSDIKLATYHCITLVDHWPPMRVAVIYRTAADLVSAPKDSLITLLLYDCNGLLCKLLFETKTFSLLEFKLIWTKQTKEFNKSYRLSTKYNVSRSASIRLVRMIQRFCPFLYEKARS